MAIIMNNQPKLSLNGKFRLKLSEKNVIIHITTARPIESRAYLSFDKFKSEE